jgi:PAS domain S-box-containing protein
MKAQPTLFRREDEVLGKAAEVLKQLAEQNSPLQSEYESLFKAYKKLLRQSKWLIQIENSRRNSPPSTETVPENNAVSNPTNPTKELRWATERRLAQFLEAIPVGVFVVDANGRPFYANEKAQQILGESIIHSTGAKDLLEAYRVYLAGTQQPYPRERHPILQALKGEVSSVEDVEIKQGNDIIPLEVWGTPIFDDHGDVAYALIAFQDIAARKMAEKEIMRFTEELSKLNQAYERFVPKQFLSLLNKRSVVEITLGEHVEKEMTILFSDIRDFTTLSEKMSPRDNFEFINAYLSQMEPIIHRHQGFIDKYIGDAIMALFPIKADDALLSAIEMLKKLSQYNNLLQLAGFPPLQIGIGLNFGSLMLGTVGGQDRMDGTVIADSVNVASRVQNLTKTYGTPLLITEKFYQQLGDVSQYKIRVIDRVTVKGKTEPVTVYEVFDADSETSVELKLATLANFEQGFKLFHGEKFEEALTFFEQVVQTNKHDKAAQVYLIHCQNVLKMTTPAKPKILIVEDTPINVKILTAVLAAENFELAVAENGNIALAMVEKKHPHLILLDVMMPELDGFETCRRLKANPKTQEIPIIFMTALADAEDKVKGFELGAVDYITKPFKRQEVLARIKTHLNISFLQQKLLAQNIELEINSSRLKQRIKSLMLQGSFEAKKE